LMDNSYQACFETAVILAGGKSKRMGFDKQLLEKDHKRLTVALAESLLKLFDQVYVVTNTPELYRGLAVRTCSDLYPGQGPMAGIHSAFRASGSECIFVIACDMTGISPDLIRYQAERFCRAWSRENHAAVSRSDGAKPGSIAVASRSDGAEPGSITAASRSDGAEPGSITAAGKSDGADSGSIAAASRSYSAQPSDAEACMICPDGKIEPFHGFYRRSLLEDIERRLQAQRNSLTGMLMDHEILRISREEAGRYADLQNLFRNINTPGDYRKYLETEAEQ
ncbi:MAG: molybdenum cofactor guanylyltransferase, partial [Lachnospiraceae bacterium]|nr:molybdenum cofactor guanylyltransferase [Lachnospiraceae bacterium]